MAAILARAHGAELELSDAHATGAELDAATMAAVLARTTGPSWSCPPRARHRDRAGTR
jgi:hypothetical protein